MHLSVLRNNPPAGSSAAIYPCRQGINFMPMLIEHIDAIARRKQRAALFVIFFEDGDGREPAYDWMDNPSRQRIIEWLAEQGYSWQQCGEMANVHIMRSYRGSIYIDIPFDTSNADYRALESFLEYPDGTMRLPDMRFCVIEHEYAMENAHHDEPGFWERWADGF
jgi:hypothetical protein